MIISYDTETTGLNPHAQDKMFAFSICNSDGETQVYREDNPAYLSTLQWIWNGQNIVVMHNAKFDLSFTKKILPTNAKIEDTFLMSHILHNDWGHDLKGLAYKLGSYPKDDEAIVKSYKLSYDKIKFSYL